MSQQGFQRAEPNWLKCHQSSLFIAQIFSITLALQLIKPIIMQRLNQLAVQIKPQKDFLQDPLDFYRLYELLSQEENQFRLKVKEYASTIVAPTINHYVETATLPTEFIEKAKPYDFINVANPSYVKFGLMYLELSKVDAGIATFFILMASLVPITIERFGSAQQKEKYLTKVKNLELLGGWALTEREVGSDASNMQTTVKKVQGGYLLNGNKRWIGNGNKDLVIVWARNTETNQVEGFIVENKWPGVTSEVIKNKLALRIVQNCQLSFQDVFVPEENRLPGVKGFASVTEVLMHSRVSVPWLAVGLQCGVYESVIRHTTQRRQFGKPIAGFQIQQERLVRILITIQASFEMVLRVSQLADQKKATPGMIASCKAWVTERTREVARLGREMMGGNGIIADNYCIKAMTDAEVLYTYEGTYDINSLIAGREVTGIAAFK